MSNLIQGEPVPGFPIRFEWQGNEWLQLFDAQVDLIKEDIARARADDRSVIYLSCPISSRGGGYSGANVDIAKFTQYRYANELGSRFWILNPAQYQMESKEGTGLIYRHAQNLGIARKTIDALPRPSGGDYMRMWTRVLVEDGAENIGSSFDAYYFLGPDDMRRFFSQGGATALTTGLEAYFASKFATDADFRAYYSTEGEPWERLRKDFLRFYGLRAGSYFSKGSHDEWNILWTLNLLRLRKYGVGEEIACFFDGRQQAFSATEGFVYQGYAI
jgi:hypothetical protein